MQEQVEKFVSFITGTCRASDGQTVAGLASAEVQDAWAHAQRNPSANIPQAHLTDDMHQVKLHESAAREGSGSATRIRYSGSGSNKRSAKGSDSPSNAGPTGAGSAGHGPEHNADRPGETCRESDL